MGGQETDPMKMLRFYSDELEPWKGFFLIKSVHVVHDVN